MKVDLQFDLAKLKELSNHVNSNDFYVTCLTDPESVAVSDVLVEGELNETESGRLVTYVDHGQAAETSPRDFLQTTFFLYIRVRRFKFSLSTLWILVILAATAKIKKIFREKYGLENNVSYIYISHTAKKEYI